MKGKKEERKRYFTACPKCAECGLFPWEIELGLPCQLCREKMVQALQGATS